MILIAESGSTKTDWRLVDLNGEISSYKTVGFNPYYIAEDELLKELSASGLSAIKMNVKSLFFYGAGCAAKENIDYMIRALQTFFAKANIEVENDMLAAARATCGKDRGLVAILGTGSNSCFYDGKEIVENVTSLGYILGDYGSGADIGKQLVRAYLEKELPQVLQDSFVQTYNLTARDILNSLYKKPLPNRFLASFNLFVAKHIAHPYLENLVKKRVQLFIEKNIVKYNDYQNLELNLVGSISAVYETIIRAEASKKNIAIGKLCKAPIDDLVQYHLLD